MLVESIIQIHHTRMTNPTGTQWETALLNKVTSNGERLALIELKLSQQQSTLDTISSNVAQIKKQVVNNENRLTEAEEILATVKLILIILRWTAGGVAAIAFSLVASFIYSFLH